MACKVSFAILSSTMVKILACLASTGSSKPYKGKPCKETIMQFNSSLKSDIRLVSCMRENEEILTWDNKTKEKNANWKIKAKVGIDGRSINITISKVCDEDIGVYTCTFEGDRLASVATAKLELENPSGKCISGSYYTVNYW